MAMHPTYPNVYSYYCKMEHRDQNSKEAHVMNYNSGWLKLQYVTFERE